MYYLSPFMFCIYIKNRITMSVSVCLRERKYINVCILMINSFGFPRIFFRHIYNNFSPFSCSFFSLFNFYVWFVCRCMSSCVSMSMCVWATVCGTFRCTIFVVYSFSSPIVIVVATKRKIKHQEEQQVNNKC